MPTQALQNRQEKTTFDLPGDGTSVDLLATAQGVGTTDNDYQEGMSVNGGTFLNFSIVNASAYPIAIVLYRRVTGKTTWVRFDSATVVPAATYSNKVSVGGFSDVRLTARGDGAEVQTVSISATISIN